MAQKTVNIASTTSVYIEAYYDGQLLSNATGFFAKLQKTPLSLITNWHVVSGRNQLTDEVLHSKGAIPNQLKIYYHAKGHTGVWKHIDIPLLDANGNPLWKEHSSFGKKVDIVALRFPNVGNSFTPSFDPSWTDNKYHLGVSDQVSIVGFPFGISAAQETYGYNLKTPIWSNGHVASEPDIDIDGLPLFYIDCRARKGQSGSPVIGTRDKGAYRYIFKGKTLVTGQLFNLWGLYSGRIHKDSDIGRVWKNSAIIDVLQQI